MHFHIPAYLVLVTLVYSDVDVHRLSPPLGGRRPPRPTGDPAADGAPPPPSGTLSAKPTTSIKKHSFKLVFNYLFYSSNAGMLDIFYYVILIERRASLPILKYWKKDCIIIIILKINFVDFLVFMIMERPDRNH